MSDAWPQTISWGDTVSFPALDTIVMPARQVGKSEAMRRLAAVKNVVFDESSHVSDAAAYMLQQVPKPKTVTPVQVACRYCGAEPGDSCQKWKRGRRGKFLVDRDPHPDRKYDARLATEAVRALTPG